MDKQLEGLETTVNEIRDALRNRDDSGAHRNSNILRVEGAGNFWNGISIGLAVAGVIAGCVWISSVATRADVAVRQAEAYRAAVYMVAPRLAEEVDKELQRQKERETE